MKTKNKLLALVEIAIVLCSVFLATMPVIAAEQTTREASTSELTTASEDDYVLDIYGNANEDDTIDMRDLTYVKLMFFGEKKETELADAKYDDKINPLDFIQIKLIIVGKEKELTFVDVFGEVVTIRKPVERIVSVWCTNNELLKVLDATDKIVGVDAGMTGKSTTLFPEISALPDCGGWYSPDFEAILSQHPDMYISWFISTVEDAESHYGLGRRRRLEEKLPGVSILCIDNNEYRTGEYVIEELKRLGYLLDRREEAEEFTEFYKKCTDQVVEQTEGLSEEKKPRVWITGFLKGGEVSSTPYTYVAFDPTDLAGARNIAADLRPPISVSTPSGFNVDLEWVIEQNPEYIFLQIWGGKSPYAPDYSISVAEERAKIILNCPELSKVDAVKNKRVYVVQYSHFSKGTSRCLCVAYLAKLFHPELFEGMKPQALHQEYVDRFLGIDVSVESANFLYSPED